MKALFLVAFASGLVCTAAFAQDVIVLKTGDEIKSKVIEINPAEIKYKRFENPDGPTIVISKSDVLMIKYENGSKDIMNAVSSPKVAETESVESKNSPVPVPGVNLIVYGTGGYLLIPPSLEELDYNSEDYDNQEMNRGLFGGGLQILYPLGKDGNIRLGADVSYTSIFKSGLANSGYLGGVVYIEEFKDAETEFRILGVVEYVPDRSPFFLEGGLGAHIVHYTHNHAYDSNYSLDEDSDDGTGVNLGMMGIAGINLFSSERISIPIMVRLDYILRYGSTLTVNGGVGLSISL